MFKVHDLESTYRDEIVVELDSLRSSNIFTFQIQLSIFYSLQVIWWTKQLLLKSSYELL